MFFGTHIWCISFDETLHLGWRPLQLDQVEKVEAVAIPR